MPPTLFAAPPACLGASHDLEQIVRTHLFLLCANNSGSTFLQKALATSRQTWNLALEGQHVLGYAGPEPGQAGLSYIWGSAPEWIARFRDPASHDWKKTRRAWYFQATSKNPGASVFTTKSPPFLLVPHFLAEAFPRTRFLIMVRDPYATAAGILRCTTPIEGGGPDALRGIVAAHLVACFQAQKRNLEQFGHMAAFFSYESMCEEPERVEAQIRALVPALDDLRLSQQIPVKRIYSDTLRNMNADQIARLTSRDVQLLNDVLGPNEEVFRSFGYELR